MTISFHVKKILQEKSITDFLSTRNIEPSKKHSDKWVYKCPIHEGDNDPSFTVYLATEDDPQTYYCFGCHSGVNIINLLSEIDNISIRESIIKLLDGIEIKDEDVFNSVVEEFDKKSTISPVVLDELLLRINRICYEFIKYVNFDREEVDFFEEVYKKIDKLALNRDIDTLQEIYNMIYDRGISKRVDYFAAKKERQQIEQVLNKEVD